MLTSILTALLSNPEVLAIVGSLLVSGLGFLMRAIFKDKAAKAESNFASGVKIAYNLVNEVARLTPNKVDDKIALGLKFLDETLNQKGQPLKPVDVERAKALFKAMHGRETKGLDPHDVVK